MAGKAQPKHIDVLIAKREKLYARYHRTASGKVRRDMEPLLREVDEAILAERRRLIRADSGTAGYHCDAS